MWRGVAIRAAGAHDLPPWHPVRDYRLASRSWTRRFAYRFRRWSRAASFCHYMHRRLSHPPLAADHRQRQRLVCIIYLLLACHRQRRRLSCSDKTAGRLLWSSAIQPVARCNIVLAGSTRLHGGSLRLLRRPYALLLSNIECQCRSSWLECASTNGPVAQCPAAQPLCLPLSRMSAAPAFAYACPWASGRLSAQNASAPVTSFVRQPSCRFSFAL